MVISTTLRFSGARQFNVELPAIFFRDLIAPLLLGNLNKGMIN